MSIKPEHDPFSDLDISPSGGVGQPMDAIPPRFQKLGTFSFLGRGAVGSVFRIRGDGDLALKVIPCGTDEARFQSARNELSILRMLRGDSHIVQLRDYEITAAGGERTVFLLEEYHKPLPTFLSGASLRVSDALRLMLGLCDALLACRRIGVLRFILAAGGHRQQHQHEQKGDPAFHILFSSVGVRPAKPAGNRRDAGFLRRFSLPGQLGIL